MTIAILTLFVFSKLDIKLNILYGSIICALVIISINNNVIKTKEKHIDIINDKIESLIPMPQNSKDYEEIVNYIFSIQEFYAYNPQAYEEIIKNIDIFFDCYEETNLDNSMASIRYNDMIMYKRNALNALHSIIFHIESSVTLTNKLNNSLKMLEILLNTYIDKVYRTNDLYIYSNGYNVNTKTINKSHIIPRNTFTMTGDDYTGPELYSYEFY